MDCDVKVLDKPRTSVRGHFEYKRIALGFAILCAENSEKARGSFMHPKAPNKPRFLSRGKRKDFLI